jgi:hypothetical protein
VADDSPEPPLSPDLAEPYRGCGKDPKPDGYDRDEFGQKWADVDRNGCDQRNDILRRDTKKRHTKPGTNGCVLQSGVIKKRSLLVRIAPGEVRARQQQGRDRLRGVVG